MEMWINNPRMIHQAVNERGFTFATIDTEFLLAPYMAEKHPRFATPAERYRAIKAATDNGQIRQLGLTLSSRDSSIVWEFNFCPAHGNFIDPAAFSNYLHASGLLHNPNMTWVMFHSAYDIAFFMKLATSWRPLPDSLPEFLSLVREFLGDRIFDVKYMLVHTNSLFGGLNEVASKLNVSRRVGKPHHAGSDSLLTWDLFMRMIQNCFADNSGIRFEGVLYGIHFI